MRKTVKLALNKYPTIPSSLRSDPAINVAKGDLEVDPARLFHHYYLDTRGYAPPKPDPARFEHLELFLPTTELRTVGDGLGIGTAFRRSTSSQLGQAFCRWFLHEYLGITYFAHMDSVLNRPPHPDFGGHAVERTDAGDAPDYLCAEDTSKVFLAEAKGRVGPISFTNVEFAKWRKQFKRVAVKDSVGTDLSVKGHIVATRFATETESPLVKSKLFAEDPKSPGERPLLDAPEIGAAVIALHYSEIAAKIRQPILASSLSSGQRVPEEIQFPAMVWEFIGAQMNRKRFVGGYFPGEGGTSPIQLNENGRVTFVNTDPMRLDISSGTFFGVAEHIFRGLCAMARQGDSLASQLQRFPDIPFFDSSASVLRDGSIIAPLQYFRPIQLEIY
ncbi:hypothetical protein AB9E09_09675 [Rhizobium leguminosarum]|uniref:hypothetical protein n=1 Tax=Rhizobium leguminosarum TaxID=384 RepID=UPI003F9E192A